MNDTRSMGVMPYASFWEAELETLELKIKELEQQNKADLKLLSEWLMSLGFSTGHGDTVKDLIAEADWQIKQIKLKIAALESGRDYLSGEYEILQKKNNELEQQLAQERDANRWIPVTERLPERSGYYFTYYGKSTDIMRKAYVDFFHDGDFNDGIGKDLLTHWKPIN